MDEDKCQSSLWENTRMVQKVNVIDLDPRFYRRLSGARPSCVWLFNVTFVLAHIRRIDVDRNMIPGVLRMVMDGGMCLSDLIWKT